MDSKFIQEAENIELLLGGKISVAPQDKLTILKDQKQKEKLKKEKL